MRVASVRVAPLNYYGGWSERARLDVESDRCVCSACVCMCFGGDDGAIDRMAATTKNTTVTRMHSVLDWARTRRAKGDRRDASRVAVH